MNYSNQTGILPPKNMAGSETTIIGVGGIGSWLALALSKMGLPRIKIYDSDTVEEHNLPSQAFRLEDTGKSKTEATKEVLTAFAGCSVTAIPEDFNGQERLKDIVICAVDSMDVRIDIWKKYVRYNPNIKLFVEARMGAEELRVYSFKPTDPDLVRRYEEFLYPSSDAHQAPCTEKSIAYTVFTSAGIIGREVKAYLTGEPIAFENIMLLKSRVWVVQ